MRNRSATSIALWLAGMVLTGLLAGCGSSINENATVDPAAPVDPGVTAAAAAQEGTAAGQVVYDDHCAGCHSLLPHDDTGFAPNLGGKGEVIAIRLQNAHNGVTLTATELADLIAFANAGLITEPLPDVALPDTPPAPAVDGTALYNGFCAGCHKLGSYDLAGFAPDLAGKSTLVTAKIAGGHGGGPFAAEALTALLALIDRNTPAHLPPPTPAPTPTPAPASVDGKIVYDVDCAGCHILGSYDRAGFAPDLAGKGALVAGKIGGGHMGVSMTASEATALIDWIDQNSPAPSPTPVPTPTPTPTPTDGKSVYDTACAGCHILGSYDPAGFAPDLSGKGVLVAAKLGAGHMGVSLSASELNAAIDWIDQNSPAPTPTPAPAPEPQCGSCHALPPNGTSSPNGTGAHAVHQALPGVGTTCSVCHNVAVHLNGAVGIGFTSTYNARSGAAAKNANGTPTCVNVSCHGGKTTPDWRTGTLNVNSQCTSCHASGTGQYNSYAGRHSKHSGRACTDCHNTATLAGKHFSRLDTPTMEGPASGSIGGGSTRISSYNVTTKGCTTSCHGSETW